MSKSVDAERAEEARIAASFRAEAELRRLLALVLMQREQLPQTVIAERLGVHRSTVRRKQVELDDLLDALGSINQHNRGKTR